MRSVVEVYGSVVPEPAGGNEPGGAVLLAAPVAGMVTAVPAREGDRVEGGALVVRLDDREALAAVEQARAAVTLAEQAMVRQQRLDALAVSSEKAAQEAASRLATARAQLAQAEARLAFVQLRSPLDGIVARIHVRPGQVVDGNTVLAEIIDPARVVVEARAPAGEAARLQAGQSAVLEPADDRARQVSGSVQFVSPQIDATTDTRRVRLSMPADAGLLPGQFVRVRIVAEERPGCLVAPLASVYRDEAGESRLARVQDGVARWQTVTTGLRDFTQVEVSGPGLAEGDVVVAVGAYALPEGARVRLPGEVKPE